MGRGRGALLQPGILCQQLYPMVAEEVDALREREALKVYRQSTIRALRKKMKNQSKAFELHLTKPLSKIMWMGKIALFLAMTFMVDLNLQPSYYTKRGSKHITSSLVASSF
ncbi:hypothetical protein SLEP1_g28197 [Rubroshorea leprosula]|uniref:Uncharacterized protein n=1 Tax=Rubroshorea leprosula TaxID=152421 RepID=A0AAV5K1K4_9ROSI|nr:hypothetical protein SLEP1_g28197 [Rubroshorea leprosula]